MITSLERMYAQAYFNKHYKVLEHTAWEAIHTFCHSLAHRADILLLLRLASVKAATKKSFLLECLERAGVILPEIEALLDLLQKSSRLTLLPRILSHVETLVREKRDIVRCVVMSAHPLSQEVKEKILTSVEQHVGKKLDPVFCIDTALIGGARIEGEGFVWDASIARLLQDIRRKELDILGTV